MVRIKKLKLAAGGPTVSVTSLVLAVCSFSAPCQVPVTQVAFSSTVNEISVASWQILGPFRVDERQTHPSLAVDVPVDPNRDYLKDFGNDENTVDARSFSLSKTPANGVPPDARSANRTISADPKSGILELASNERDQNYAVAYVAAVLSSPKDQDIVIAFGMDDNGKAWLNHELLFSDANTKRNRMRTFHHLIGVHLKKGDNFFLLKAGNLMAYWSISVTLFPHDQNVLELAQDNAVDSILKSAVVSRDQPLELRGDLLPTAATVHLEISDAKHTVVGRGELKLERNMTWDLTKLDKDKLYYCRATAAGQTVEQPFYYGDLQTGFERLTEQVDHVSTTDESIKVDLSAPLIRIKHLLLPENRSAPWWDQKVAELFTEAENNIANLAAGVPAFRSAGGSHLRGYRSSVDGQIQHYWIHIPENLSRATKRIPLVIVLPWTPSTNLPFLESAQLAEFAEDERYEKLGNEYGFAVLQLWGRGMLQGGTAIWNTDVFEALEAVQRDYPVDMDRIYLTGTCEGGRQALLLAERNPGRFAAVAVDGPITNIRRRPGFNSLWVQYGSPISQAEKLVDTPVFISHAVNNDDPPIEDSESFSFRVRETGGNITLVRREGGNHFLASNFTEVKRSFFEFFKGNTKASSPHNIPASPPLDRFGVGKGPIEDAFGGPVLFVQGTQGTPEQNLAIQGNLEEFEADWRESYFVDCPTKKDTEITGDDIRDKNLIIFGDADTNALVKPVAGSSPILRTSHGISIEGKNVDGDQLAYIFVSPNPLNLKKYIVEIAMNQWKAVKGWRLHLPRNGVCDYSVFDLQKPAPRLIDAGYFDHVW